MYRGSHFPDCRNLASTFSASSIATLSTGAWPSQHGIVADSWFDRAAKTQVRASSELLLATTLGAQAAASGLRTYAIGLDPAQTALFAGNSKVNQYWLDSGGQFTTLGDPPKWLTEFNNAEPIENKHNATWSAADARQGAPPLRKLVYDAGNPQEFINLYKASPFSQAAQFSLTANLIEKERLGSHDAIDFVCVVASSSALLGYEYGGRSPIMREMMLALDSQLAFLFERLDAAAGEGGYNLVLAGAHGAPPLPPLESRDRMAVSGEAVARTIDRALLGAGAGHVLRYIYPFVYLDPNGARDPGPAREFAARAALDHPAVAGFYTADGYCSEHDVWASRFGNSFHAKRSGDLMLSYHPEYVEEYPQGHGISYGSLYNYDVSVPVFCWGPSFRAGVFEQTVQSVDVTATLARILGVAAPSSCVGRALSEAFAE